MLALSLSAALITASATARGQEPDEFDRMQWLAGCWELRTSTAVTHEQWMAPLGETMLGMSRTVVAGSTREFEHLRIERVGGVVTYLAQPGGATPTPFSATIMTDSMLTFSNPDHDFPQRITYRRMAHGDSLMARIEGTRGATVRDIDFPMRRVACGAMAARRR
ncbi:MAG: DUF6265 family protein [Gemmatimonadota bacterium]